jgi:hypothetical protein
MKLVVSSALVTLNLALLLALPSPVHAGSCSFSLGSAQLTDTNKPLVVYLDTGDRNTTFPIVIENSSGTPLFKGSMRKGDPLDPNFRAEMQTNVPFNSFPTGSYVVKVSSPTEPCAPVNGRSFGITKAGSSGFSGGIVDRVPDPLAGRFQSVGQIISELLPYVYTLAAMLALLFLVWGGFRYMTARGDSKAVEAARSIIYNSVIGVGIILAAGVIYFLASLVFQIEIFSLATPVHAQETVDIGCTVKLAGGRCISEVFPSLGVFFTAIMRFALGAAAAVFFIMLMFGGFRYLTAGGEPKAAEGARGTITNAAVGLLLVLLAFVIIELITNVAGVDPIIGG